MRRIIVGGCLAMVYITGVNSPVTTEYFRAIGADEWHFGLIGGIPFVLLAMQFIGAAMVNRVACRRRTFFFCLVACRLAYLPIAFLPWDRLGLSTDKRMMVVSGLLGLSALLHNYAVPFWFSWMADLIPRPILNRFWGRRQWAMHTTWAVSFIVLTVYLYFSRQSPITIFRTLVAVAVVAGMVDIMLFIPVREPPNLTDFSLSFWRALWEPWHDASYRSFVRFSCAWSFATMFAAAFMQLYVLKVIGLAPWKTALIWCLQGIGTGMVSSGWGRIADRHGHRPIFNLCIMLKFLIVIVFIALTPQNVSWLLPITLFLDGMLNAGTMVASNGYMLSHSPQRNRSMFIANITGLAGLAGGTGAILSGALLKRIGAEPWSWGGRNWNAYQIVFALSLVMRVLCIPLVRRIREDRAARPIHVLNDLIGDFPLRFLRFPIGLYRHFFPDEEPHASASENRNDSPGAG